MSVDEANDRARRVEQTNARLRQEVDALRARADELEAALVAKTEELTITLSFVPVERLPSLKLATLRVPDRLPAGMGD